MAKIILKSLLWGVISWLVLSVLLFFGVGFYQGLIGSDFELSRAFQSALRFAVFIFALGVAAFIFIREEKKQKPFKHIVAEEKPKPKAPLPPPFVKKEVKPEFHGTVMPKMKEVSLPPRPQPPIAPKPPSSPKPEPRPEFQKPPAAPKSPVIEPRKLPVLQQSPNQHSTQPQPPVIYPEKPKMEENADRQKSETEKMAQELADNLNKNVGKPPTPNPQPPVPAPQPPPWNRP